MIGWTKIISFSKIQFIVALSSMEVEYVVATVLSKEMIWLQMFMDQLGKMQEIERLYSDNQSVIHGSKNSTFHSKRKNR